MYDPLWYPDSDASNHLTPNSLNFSFKTSYEGSERVQVGNRVGMSIQHTGHFNMYSPSFNTSFILHNLLHVHSLTKNPMSVSQFAKQNKVFLEFHADTCFVKCQDSKKTLLQGFTKDGLYVFLDMQKHSVTLKHASPIVHSHVPTTLYPRRIGTASNNSFLFWHSRLGHPSSNVVHRVLQLCKIPSDMNKISHICDSYCIGKHHQLPFTVSTNVYTEPLALVYCDIWAPSPLLSHSGAGYYLTFLDAATKFTWIYFLNQKSQALSTFIQFKTLVEKQLNKQIKSIQIDNAKEFLAFTKFF